MPDLPDPKLRPHPWSKSLTRSAAAMRGDPALGDPAPSRAPVASDAFSAPRMPPADPSPLPGYAELHVTTHFTFLTGAGSPEEYVERAAALGHEAIAITDVNTLAGVVRAHVAAREAGVRLIVGCHVRCVAGFSLQDAPPPPAPEASAPATAPFPSSANANSSAAAAMGVSSARPRRVSILLYPTDRASYGRLCRLLTLGKRRAPKGECHLTLHDVIHHQQGLLAVLLPPESPAGPEAIDQDFIDLLAGLRGVFDDDRLSLATACLFGQDDRGRLAQLAALSAHVGVPLVATNDVHYPAPDRRPLQDVLTCIRLGRRIDQAGLDLFPHAERHLKPPAEMARLFAAHPQAIDRALAIARRAGAFSLDALRYEYPDESCPPGRTPMEHLTDLTLRGAAERYPRGVPEKVRAQIRHELTLIDELRYAPYFLTVHDLVVFARGRGILCQGRGAAANSAVCYCLGVTSVDPDRIDVLFERFVSRERNEPPDIDIDFEHERREEVIQYIYARYGRERAALTGVVITYRPRSAVRDVGKALGLSLDAVDRMAKNLDWWDGSSVQPQRLADLGLNPDDPLLGRLLELVRQILGFPRHLSQHVGGFVITRGPLCESVPIENAVMEDRTVIEWDKDDIDAMGMLKVDVLALGMLTCIRKAFDFINARPDRGGGSSSPPVGLPLTLANVPAEDPAVYDMLCEADTVGVFQIESRAQMSMLPRLRPRRFYDLVIEVAIVRPGPIQGDMVHPYLRRRNGEEAVTYPSAAVEKVLGKTLGVPLFQEQAMALAIVAAGFTPGEADQLRRAIAAWKSKQKVIFAFGQRLIEGMIANGYDPDFARRCFEQIKGFSEYGFPESHAASFALLVYVSSWIKRHHPAVFAAALINSQPMGFYAPAQIIRDARAHGVKVLPIDANLSQWDCTLEDPPFAGDSSSSRDSGGGGYRFGIARRESEGPAIRLGLRLVRGLAEFQARAVTAAVRRHGPFRDIATLYRSSGVRAASLRRLAQADAFGSMGIDRPRALWEVRALRDDDLPLFDALPEPAAQTPAASEPHAPEPPAFEIHPPEPAPRLPPVSASRRVLLDYSHTGLSLKAHPLSFLRDALAARRVRPAAELADPLKMPNASPVAVAGLVLVRQRPGTASGIVFMTLEDETGVSNLIVRPHIYQRFRPAARHGVAVIARGRVERQGKVVHVMVSRIEDIGSMLGQLAVPSRDFH